MIAELVKVNHTIQVAHTAVVDVHAVRLSDQLHSYLLRPVFIGLLISLVYLYCRASTDTCYLINLALYQ